jgi:hypothetical protein
MKPVMLHLDPNVNPIPVSEVIQRGPSTQQQHLEAFVICG